MTEKNFLLNDDEIARFIVQGYLIIEGTLPLSFHQHLEAEAEKRFQKCNTRMAAAEVFATTEDLRRVYDDPKIKGALESLLGPNYSMNDHRPCHIMFPGTEWQPWHQDGVNMRHHQVRRLLAMYYPHDVTPDLGPTVVMPGTHFRNAPSARMAS